jgi:hypothetical protein
MSEELERLFQETHNIIRRIKREVLGEIEFLAVAEDMKNDKPEEKV